MFFFILIKEKSGEQTHQYNIEIEIHWKKNPVFPFYFLHFLANGNGV